MQRKLTHALACVCAVTLALTVGACGNGAASHEDGAAAQSSGPIKVALITDVSGAVALFGEANVNGAKMAVDELNADGGVLNRKVQLLVKDSKATPETGVQLARDAILRDKVAAIFGPVSSGVAVAMTEVAKQYKTPIFFHTSNSQALTTTNFHKYAFSVVPNSTMEGRGNALGVKDLGYKRWAVLAPDYEFGHAQSDAFIQKLKQLDPSAQIVKKLYPPLGETDFNSYIRATLAAKPDAVYTAMFAGDIIAFTKQARAQGLFDKAFVTGLYDTDALQALKDQAPEGVRAYGRAPFYAIHSPGISAFNEKYKAKYGKYPSDWAIMAYDAVKVWAQGVEKAGKLDPDALVSALEGAQVKTLRGTVEMRAADHQAAVPVYSGTVTQKTKFGFPAWKDVSSTPGAKVWLTVPEAKAAQKG